MKGRDKSSKRKPKEGRKPQNPLVSTDGDDLLLGGNKADVVSGSLGNDTIKGDKGNDQLLGGIGNDILEGGLHNDTIDGGEGDDQLIGGVGNDIAKGGLGNDMLLGGNGKDKLYGDAGNDTLLGGNGNDVLVGANATAPQPMTTTAGTPDPASMAEVDTLTGGNGKDTFVLGIAGSVFYTAAGDADYALITDFKQSDRIQLTGEASSYTIGAAPAGAPVGVGIYAAKVDATGLPSSELIAVLAGADAATIDHSKFIYA